MRVDDYKMSSMMDQKEAIDDTESIASDESEEMTGKN